MVQKLIEQTVSYENQIKKEIIFSEELNSKLAKFKAEKILINEKEIKRLKMDFAEEIIKKKIIIK